MKIFLIAGGLFILVFVCIIPLKRHLAEYNAQKNGQLVVATITEVPDCLGTRVKHYLKFMYNHQIYSKTIGAPCSQYRVGQEISLKHTPDTDIFLYENENIESQFISTGVLALAGLAFVLMGFKKRNAHNIDLSK